MFHYIACVKVKPPILDGINYFCVALIVVRGMICCFSLKQCLRVLS